MTTTSSYYDELDITDLIEGGNITQYTQIIEDLKEHLTTNFKDRKNVITLTINDNDYTMRLSNLLTTLVLLKPFVDFKVLPPNDDFIIIDLSKNKDPIVNDNVIANYLNNVIKYLTRDYSLLNESIAYVIMKAVEISALFSYRVGNTISIWAIYELLRKILNKKDAKELYDLIHTKIDLSQRKQINEIQKEIDVKTERLIEILKNNSNHFSIYLKSGSGINPKQLKEFMVSCGFKPNVDDTIIEEPINANFITGLQTIQDFYIACKGTRMALNTNHSKVKDSGYLTRKLTLLNIDTLVDNEIEDCGSKNYIKLKVRDKDTAKKLINRIYYDENDDALYKIEEDDLNSIIGTTINLRSPITCCTKNICKTCYGFELSEINKNRHPGLLGVLFLTSILTQLLLSSKHLLQANTSQLEFGPVFDKYFSFDRNSILVNDAEATSSSEIVIQLDDLIESEVEDDSYEIAKLTIRGKDGETEPIMFPTTLKLTKAFWELLFDNFEGDEYSILIKDIPHDLPLFTMLINNIGLASSLKSILDLIEKADHLGLSNIDDIHNKFIELLCLNRINLDSVHVELILRNLVRDVNNPYSRPNYTKEVLPEDYVVLRVTEANIKHESVTVGIAFEEVEKQLLNPETYAKAGSSIIDPIFTR